MRTNNFILASASPRRRKLLEMLGISLTVCKSGVNEFLDPGLEVSKLVQKLAFNKAVACSNHFPDSLVAGADTVVALDEEVLGKPESRPEAMDMLKKLSGRSHRVITGVALLKTDTTGGVGENRLFFEETKVTFASLTDYEIEIYVDSEAPYDKAGGYGIQDDLGALFVSRIEGDYYNVVGLPLHALYRQLKDFAPEYCNLLMGNQFHEKYD